MSDQNTQKELELEKKQTSDQEASVHNEDQVNAENFSSEEVTVDESALNQLIQQLAENKKQVEANERQMEEMEKQVNEMYEQFMRARADLENYRRRARKEKEDAIKFANVPILEALLPVLDNFERALDASDQTQEKSEDAKAIQQGIEMVYRQFIQVMHDRGLEMIDALGKPFNPHEHNAVMQVTMENVESGIVVEELQAGYRYQDRVIRPTMVKVNS